MTKYHPILFSTPMVQGIQNKIKRQTRRTKGLEEINRNPDQWRLLTSFDNPEDLTTAFYTRTNGGLYVQFMNGRKNSDIKCPYNIGDVLWVRETCMPLQIVDVFDNEQILYRANPEDEKFIKEIDGKWKPSIFMPKHACRIFLKIQSIRVERLQDISEEDAKAEGVLFHTTKWKDYFHLGTQFIYSLNLASQSFKTLWWVINGISSWHSNPFVFVYEFEQIEKPLDFIV